MFQASNPQQSSAHRLGCACGAVVTTVGLATALVGAFLQTAAPLWLEVTPDLLEQVSGWEALPPRDGGEDCLQGLAEARLGDLRSGVQWVQQHPATAPR